MHASSWSEERGARGRSPVAMGKGHLSTSSAPRRRLKKVVSNLGRSRDEIGRHCSRGGK